MTLKQIESFHGKDCSLSFPLCICKISWTNLYQNKYFLVLSLISYLCYRFIQVKNVFQSTIATFKCASISQHNENIGCCPPLIAHFNHKIFSKYLGTSHTKCDVMKIVKL